MVCDVMIMIIAIPSCIKLEKKAKEEGIGEKSDSLNEEKDDKPRDRKVEDEKTNDSVTTITGASVGAALAEEQKTDDSVSLEASVEDNPKDEKEQISESPATPVTETASDAPISQQATGERNQPEAVKKSQESGKESQEKERVDQPNIDATPGSSVVTTREPESNAIAEAMKETANSEARTPENPIETEMQSGEEKPGDMIEVHPPTESDIESFEAVTASAYGEKKPIENSQVAQQVKEQSEVVETEQQRVGESTKSEETSTDTKDPALMSKEEEGTSVSTQVSLDKEALVANEVESSPGITGNVVEEDGKKEPSGKDVIEGMSKGSVGVLENPEQVFVNQEAKTDLQEEKEDFAAPSVQEKVAANDDKKERDARDDVEGLSREADTVAINEEDQDELASVKDDQPADINENEEHAEKKVDEITGAASETVRGTSASKFEQNAEESITSEADKEEKYTAEETVKTRDQIPDPLTKEIAAKPPRKQSNNILYKVKRSLQKAKKAITGKSPTTKTLSSEAKGDIQVK